MKAAQSFLFGEIYGGNPVCCPVALRPIRLALQDEANFQLGDDQEAVTLPKLKELWLEAHTEERASG